MLQIQSKKIAFPRLPGVWAQSSALNWPIPVKKAPLGALVVFKPPPCSVSLNLPRHLLPGWVLAPQLVIFPCLIQSHPHPASATEAQHPPLALNLATLLGFDSDSSFSVCSLPAALGYNLDWEASKHLAVSASVSAEEERSILFSPKDLPISNISTFQTNSCIRLQVNISWCGCDG